MSEQTAAEQAIQAILRATSPAVGKAFFEAFVLELAGALHVRYSYVGELISMAPERVRTIALCADGAIVPNIEYDLQGTPCANVVNKSLSFYLSEVQRLFPEDPLLAQMDAQSYLGVPLVATSGRPLGLLAVVHDKPMPEGNLTRDVLNLFAGRAGAELERLQTEEDVRREHDLLGRLMEASPAGIVMINAAGQIVLANRRAEEVLGLTREAITQRAYNAPEWRITDYAGGPFPEEKLPVAQVLATSAPVYGVRHAIEWPDGRRVLLSINAMPLLGGDGQVEGVITTVEDVTARVRSDEALRGSERRLRDIVDAAPFGAHIYELQPDGRLVFVGANRSADEISRIDHRQLIGKTIEEAFPGLVGTDIPDTYRRVAARGEGYTADQVAYDTAGVRGVFEVWALQTGPGRMAAFFRDVTEQKRAEEAIRYQAETLAALHETALDLSAQRTLPDLLQAIVVRAAALLGAPDGGFFLYRPGTADLELVGKCSNSLSRLGTVLARGEGLPGKVLEAGRSLAVADDSISESGAVEIRADQRTAAVAVPVCWGERVLGVLCLDDVAPRTFSEQDIALLERFAPLAAAALENHRLFQDVQQQMERLKEAQAQLVQSAKMAALGTLAAGVAHEINNPLTSVLGFAEIVSNEAPDDFPLREEVQIIATESRRVSRIVRALLDFSRQTKAQRSPTHLNQVLQQTLVLIGEHMVKTGVTIAEDYASDLGPLSLDEGQMKQVFLNLITNAAQAMPSGGQLRIRTARVGGEATVSISDTGAGIPPETQEHLFEPFYTTKTFGTGLGLSVSLGIVQAHGGRITVESQEGKGSTFTVWLPAQQG